MHHIIFKESPTYKIALLIKSIAFNARNLSLNYVSELTARGIPEEDVIAFTLKYSPDGKASVAFIKEYLNSLLPALASLGVKQLLVADGNYFKVLTGQGKADPHYGYVLPCKIKGYEDMNVVLSLNYQQLIYNPSLQAKLALSLDTLVAHMQGSYQAIGTSIIHSAQYPTIFGDIQAALQSLHQYPRLVCDIETFSLKHDKAGIGTIGFAWDKHNGLAFAVDYFQTFSSAMHANNIYGIKMTHFEIRHELVKFFTEYQGELIFHNCTFDMKMLIVALWMESFSDVKGLLEGLDILTRKFHDTKIIAYLATNSTAGNKLKLKELAHEFAGNWAVEVTDITKVALTDLLQYNLVDCLSTFYVFDKYYPVMVRDQQEDLYKNLMMPSQKLITQLELTGMPLNLKKVKQVKEELTQIQTDNVDKIQNSPLIKTLDLLLQDAAWGKDYESRKAKAKNPGKILPKSKAAFDDVSFNPNSGPQLQRLLYELMGLPVIDLTDTKQPATGADTIEKLINHATDPLYKEILQALINYGKCTKILNTFIPAFEAALSKDNSNTVWLHGSFNLGGTVSGRLSSSDPKIWALSK